MIERPRARGRWVLVGLAGLAGCVNSGAPAAPACASGDIDCFAAHMTFRDDAGNELPIVFVDSATVAALSASTAGGGHAPVLTSGPPALTYAYGTVIGGVDVVLSDPFQLGFTDPNGCQPVVGFTLTGHGARSKHTGCFPGLHDGKRAGTIASHIGFTATAAVDESFAIELVLIASTDCASIDDPAALVVAPTAVANSAVTIPLTIAPPPGDGSGSSSGGGSGGNPGGGGSCSVTYAQCCSGNASKQCAPDRGGCQNSTSSCPSGTQPSVCDGNPSGCGSFYGTGEVYCICP